MTDAAVNGVPPVKDGVFPPVTDREIACAAEKLVKNLAAAGQTVATCESLTAGLVAASIAQVPGASQVLRGGLVTYQTDTKHILAGVNEAILDDPGPVSSCCAKAMAIGARQTTGADWAVSLTGVAGPEPVGIHPVGEVWIGMAFPTGRRFAARARPEGRHRWGMVLGADKPVPLVDGDRNHIRRVVTCYALSLLAEQVAQTLHG
ncbi:CinA family protein [Corynebacterium mendelii]|uniref:Nicotinamide-nucleotide amidohydrolase family protein n=1 Tax=Corynebacterium mendelii TaxID=2765362 RepID=A0A939DXZ6_9CORY|nr:CinA family protein [Corynebacterium mendelii]MBN9643299.1 nicotinamide-nucleotide amidohydrolase family protein [Corynebacterium mendelii]